MRAAARLLGVAVSVSKAPTVAVLLTVVGAVLVLIEAPTASRWLGAWTDTGLYLSVLSFAIAGALFAVVGFFTGSRWTRDPRHDLARAVPSGGQVVVLAVAGDLVWLWSALGIVHVTALARTASVTTESTELPWPLLVLGFASATACYALAALAGALAPTTFAVVGVAPLPYVATLVAGEVAVSARPQTQQLIAPFIDQVWYPLLVPAPGPLLVLTLYCVAVGVLGLVLTHAALTLRHHRRRPSTRTTRALGLAVVVVAASSTQLVLSWTPQAFSRPNPAAVVCTDDRSVCVWAGSSAALAPVERALDRVEALVGPVGGERLAFHQAGAVDASSTQVEIDIPATHAPDEVYVEQILEAYEPLIASHCGLPEGTDEAGDLMAALRSRVRSDDVLPGASDPATSDPCRA